MNKNGLNKKFRMGWNDYVRLMSLLVFLGLSLCAATAQEKKAQLDVTRLVGADPASIINKDNTHRITPNNEIRRRNDVHAFERGHTAVF